MRMPTLFVGHGSPMLALDNNEITNTLKSVGDEIIAKFGKPKAILAISAHWFKNGNFIQSAQPPTQVYDMYGFPKELYEVTYSVNGYQALTNRVLEMASFPMEINDDWGIDHGMWTVLIHMFPKADIPVVQLSVNSQSTAEEAFRIGQALQSLREEGYLIIASGNVVHNLRLTDFNREDGTAEADRFDEYIKNAVLAGNIDTVLGYENHPHGSYAVPTIDHYWPLCYALGTVHPDETVRVFNNLRNLGTISMTSYIWGLDTCE